MVSTERTLHAPLVAHREVKRSRGSTRVPAVDALRGWAVVLMIVWHTADGWLAANERLGAAGVWLERLGGHAAPLFLLLVGTSVALLHRRGGVGSERLVGRGIALLAGGFLLSLGGWLLDSLGILSVSGGIAASLGLAGALVLLPGCRCLERGVSGGAGRIALGAVVLAIALAVACHGAPAHASRLLRVDVLHLIGVALVVLAVARHHPAAAAACALLIAWSAPSLAAVAGPLPYEVSTWVVTLDGNADVARFPLFPWLAYPLMGLALGSLLARERTLRKRAAVAVVAIGITVALLAFESFPHGYWLAHLDAGAAHLVRLCHRTGVAVALFGTSVLLSHAARPLSVLGRASLPLYVAHVELAYGIASHPVRRQLDLIVWLVAVSLLLIAAWGLARMRAGNVRNLTATSPKKTVTLHARREREDVCNGLLSDRSA